MFKIPEKDTVMNKRNLKSVILCLVMFVIVVSSYGEDKGWPRGGASEEEKFQASPLLIDLDGIRGVEIIVPGFDDKLYVYNHDGTTYDPGGSAWPVTMGYSDGTIGSAAAGDVDGDGNIEIVILGDDINSQNATVKVYEADGSLLSQKVLNSYASGKATPCIIDCYRYIGNQRNEAEEILIRDGDGRVHILYWDSTNTQFSYVNSALETCDNNLQKDRHGAQPITPSVSAMYMGDDITYIVIPSTNNKIYRWFATSESGTSSDNWQMTTTSTLQSAGPSDTRFLSSAAIADLENDGEFEIICGSTNKEVYVWDYYGNVRDGWPALTGETVISSPAIADLDADGELEVIVGSDDGLVYAWNPDGTYVSGWPNGSLGDVFGSPVTAEIDGNPGPEVVATSFDGYMYAWDGSGTTLSGWPKRLNTTLYSSPAVGDLHFGGRQAVITGGYDGRLFVFDLSPKSTDLYAGWRQFRGNARRQGSY